MNNRRARQSGAPKTRDKMDGSAIRPYLLLFAVFLASCAAPDTQHQIVVSTREQKLALIDRGNVVAIYPVSTSKFGLGDWRGSRFTPLGKLQIAEKIGDSAPPGTVFKDRRRTGEIVAPDSPGRDPIVTRILWLRGLEAQNANAFGRDIYIHGHSTVQCRGNGRRSYHRERATSSGSPEPRLSSFDGRYESCAVCNAIRLSPSPLARIRGGKYQI